MGENSGSSKYKIKGFMFSLLHLENYRTIKSRSISFDHRYKYNPNSATRGIVLKNESPSLAGPFFYGPSVFSMSCIVGRNGDGKTSLIEFIRDSFIFILKDIQDGIINVDESGFLSLEDSDYDYYHLDKGTKTGFLIIFRMNNHYYYITNMKGIDIDDSLQSELEPFQKQDGEDLPVRNGIVYFSQIRYRMGVAQNEVRIGREAIVRDSDSSSNEENGRNSDKKNVNRDYSYIPDRKLLPYRIDMSEENMDTRRDKRLHIEFNPDILFQLVYLSFLKSGSDEANNFLNETEIKKSGLTEFIQYHQVHDLEFGNDLKGTANQENGIRNNTKNLKYLLKEVDSLNKADSIDYGDLRTILISCDSYMRPFSSGEYNHFALMSRLYWIICGRYLYGSGDDKGGDSKWIRTVIDSLAPDNLTGDENVIPLVKTGSEQSSDEKSGSLVLLFDEGDLCYHPEWQRCFIHEILSLIRFCSKTNVQIILTTNSPFMLSDFLREDIFTLADDDHNKLENNIMTFGQNIHMLLAHRFFMDSTIGRTAEKEIIWLLELFDEKDQERLIGKVSEKYKDYFLACRMEEIDRVDKRKKINIVKDFLKKLINNIGEEMYRRYLQDRYEKYFCSTGTAIGVGRYEGQDDGQDQH